MVREERSYEITHVVRLTHHFKCVKLNRRTATVIMIKAKLVLYSSLVAVSTFKLFCNGPDWCSSYDLFVGKVNAFFVGKT